MTTPPPAGFTRHYPAPGEQSRADFVLVGRPLPDGTVEVWASTEVPSAELEAETLVRDVAWDDELGAVVPSVVSYTLRAGLRRFVIVRAPTYRKALAGLAAHPGWEPAAGG